MTFSSPSTPSISRQQLRDDGGLHIGADTGAAGAEDRVHLVEEHDHRGALRRLLPGALEDQPDVPLGLADELVEQLRALDVEEVRLRLAGVVAAHLGHLLGQRVGHRLGDQRLAAAGRAVEQHALRRPQRVLAVELLVQERQLDGVADLLDLPGQAADVAVADVGHLFEDQVLDLGLGDALERVPGLGVDQQRVAGPQLARPIVLVERLGDLRRAGLRRATSGSASHTMRSSSAWPTTSARWPSARISRSVLISPTDSKLPASTTVSASLRRTVWPFLSDLTSMFGRAGQAHLAARGEHVDGVVVLRAQQHAVAAGRLAQTVDLLAQRQQLLTGLLEGFHQLGVPGGERVDPRLQLVHVTGAAQSALGTDRVLQLLAQNRRLSAQFFQFGRILAGHRVFRRLQNALTHSCCAPSRTESWCSNNFNATGDSVFVCGVGIRHTSNTVNL